MEPFMRAHLVKNKTVKNRKLLENKKKQLKQMLHGYKTKDNKLIQKTSDCQNDYTDSTSVSGYSDLNLTNSSEDETHLFTLKTNRNSSIFSSKKENTTSFVGPNNDKVNISCTDTVLECDESLGNDIPVNSTTSNIISDDDSNKTKTYLNEQSISECKLNTKSFESDNSWSVDPVDHKDTDTCSESEYSIASSNITESDTSKSFDGDGQLAAKIQQMLQLKNIQKQKQKCRELDVGNSYTTQESRDVKVGELTVSEDENCIDENEVLDIPSIMSPSYVSITASDMPTQSLNEVIGNYKNFTIKNILPEKLYTSFNVEENMSVDIQVEDEVGSLIPELDDIPKLEEIEEELANLDTTVDSLDISMKIDNNSAFSERVTENEGAINYDDITDKFKVYYGTHCCIIILKHPSELFIQGKIEIRPLGGTVEVFGYTLKNETYSVYAPYYNFAQCIKTVESQNIFYGLFAKLTAAGLSVSEAEDIVTTVGEYDGVIQLQELKCKIMDYVDNNFKITNLFLKSDKIVEPYFSKAADILKCSLFSSTPFKSFYTHPSWVEALDLAQNDYSRGIVCGGKGVGKSTYLRYQVNKLLAHGPVLVVDLDPGQSEFTVAGNVSATIVESPLFGPSFGHLRKPDLMLSIGLINTMDNAKLYVSAVRTLITYCRTNKEYASMPWIINTMGMTNALGLKFITFIIILAQPTFILQYESKTEKQSFKTILTPHNVRYLYEDYRNDPLFKNVTCPDDLEYAIVVAYHIDGPTKHTYNLKPRDERYLNFMAYFSQLILKSNVESLLAVTPYEVNFKDLCIATNIIFKEDYITKVINGKIVALCQHARQYNSRRVFTLSDKPLLCHGYGLIRGIDWEKEILYVITPVPSSELGDVDTLLYADWIPELIGLENQLPPGTTVPYRILTALHHKQLMSPPQRRFNPLQLLKMSRNT